MKLKDKNVLITGASSGIGKALAFECAKRGTNLCIGARRLEKLLEIKKEIEERYSVKVIVVKLDVTDVKSVKYFVGAALENLDSIDILVNNAGVGLNAPVELTEERDYDYVMNINVKGVYLVTKEIVPIMKQQYKGIIVNISSLGGYIGMPLYSVYSASKFAIRGFTESWRMELRRYNIKVIGVYPGVIPTEFQEKTRRYGNIKKSDKKINFALGEVNHAAQKIVDGIEREKRDIFIKPLWWLVAALVSRYPALGDWLYINFYEDK
jgi:hypothetical protein